MNVSLDQDKKVQNDQTEQLTNSKSILDPPDCISGLKELDRSKLIKRIQVTCLKVKTKKLKLILKTVKPYLLKKPNFSSVVRLGKLFRVKRANLFNNLISFIFR